MIENPMYTSTPPEPEPFVEEELAEDPTDDAPDHDFELDAIRDWEDEHGR